MAWTTLVVDSGTPLARGFSGCPVWVDDVQAVVGIMVATDSIPAARRAYLLPTSQLARLWPPLIDAGLAVLSHPDGVYGVAFSPDGTRLATGGEDDAARVWDLTAGREQAAGQEQAWLRHSGRVYGVAFSPDGTRLATGSEDGPARVWDVRASRELTQFSHRTDTDVRAVAFSPDGTRLATGGHDGTARVWDLSTHRELSRFAHRSFVQSVAFSPDGTKLATGGDDATAGCGT